MKESQANTTIVLFTILNAITAFIFFVIALAVTFLTPFAATVLRSVEAFPLPPNVSEYAYTQLATGVGIIVGILVFLLAAFFLSVARGLWKRHTWARYAQLVLCVPQLFSFPIGTLFGVYGIYAFGFDKEVRSQFGVTLPKEAKTRSATRKKK